MYTHEAEHLFIGLRVGHISIFPLSLYVFLCVFMLCPTDGPFLQICRSFFYHRGVNSFDCNRNVKYFLTFGLLTL